MRDNLIRYVPEILKRNLEFQIIMRVHGDGLVKLWDATQEVFDGQFINTADEYAIGRYEAILDVSPEKGDDLETRRKRVLMAWKRGGTPSLKTVQEICDVWLPGGIEATYGPPGYVNLYYLDTYETAVRRAPLERQIRKIIPANVELSIGISRTAKLYALGYMQSANLDITIPVPLPD